MSYFESRLKINIKDFNDIVKKLEFCEKLGIKNLIFEPTDVIKIPLDIKKRINEITKINIFYRINLKPLNIKEFKDIIKNYNNYADLLSVETLNKEVQIAAAKDSRVGIVSFSDQRVLKTLTPGVISLTKQNNSLIEFSLASIITENRTVQSKNFRNLYHFIQLARKRKANYLISGNFKNIFDFRHPRALISICHSLLEIPLMEAKMVFSNNPKNLIKRIQTIQDKNILDFGIKLIKEDNKNG